MAANPSKQSTKSWAIASVASFALLMIPLSGVLADNDGAPQSPRRHQVVAPGLIEPVGEEREISASAPGILESVRVKEGDSVAPNQVIAVLQNEEQKARLAVAKAELALRETNSEFARVEYSRRVALAQSRTVSPAAFDAAKNAKETAEAQVAIAKANVALAQAQLDQTFVKAPIAGLVLRILRREGESISKQPATPVAIIGDTSKLRVRAQIDETDVGRAQPGERVEIRVDAYPGRVFGGTVTYVSRRLSGKTVETRHAADRMDNATDTVDTKILEALIDLDKDVDLPIALRVDVFFLGKLAKAQLVSQKAP